MKIRKGFVSNSSSSSFVIDNVETVTTDISCDILINAIKKCFPKLDKFDLQFYKIDRQDEVQSKKELKLAKNQCYERLKGWTDNMNKLTYSYNMITEQLKRFGKTNYNPDESPYQQDDTPLETPIIQTINILKKNMGIQSMIECVESSYSKLLIMMNENVMWQIDGIQDNKKKGTFESDPYTVDRFCEILSKKLWELGYDINYHDLISCFHGVPHMG